MRKTHSRPLRCAQGGARLTVPAEKFMTAPRWQSTGGTSRAALWANQAWPFCAPSAALTKCAPLRLMRSISAASLIASMAP